MPKAKSKAAYMISAVAEQYELHPQTLRLYEREGLLKPSRSEGNTRLYTDGDLERLVPEIRSLPLGRQNRGLTCEGARSQVPFAQASAAREAGSCWLH